MNIHFITFEGGEGSGKTTLIKKLVKDLTDLGINVLSTREPGGSKIAEEIRGIILNVENTEMDYRTEALLYAASRRQHLKEVILPAIQKNMLVICDRYIDSSLAYQGYARGLGIDEVYNINLYATAGLLPDLTILIDERAEVGLQRIKDNNRDFNRLDLEKINFHEKVRQGYLEVLKKFPERIVKVNGERTIDEVYQDVYNIVIQKING